MGENRHFVNPDVQEGSCSTLFLNCDLLQAAFSRSKGGKVAGSEYLAAASFGVVDVLSLKFNPPPPRPEKKKTEDAGCGMSNAKFELIPCVNIWYIF